MSLQPGTTLGSYAAAALIGCGGMSKAYQARDTTVDRDVASAAKTGNPGL